MNAPENERSYTFSRPAEHESIEEGMPSEPPERGLEKSVTVEQQLPKPCKAVEEEMGADMPDRK